MWRSLRVLLLACLLPIATALPASASPPSDIAASLGLSALWSKVFETPNPQNPFGTGGTAATCLNLAPGVVSGFGPGAVPGCTVNRGTTLVVTPWTYECSTFEELGLTPAELRQCAIDYDAGASTTLTVDGKSVPTSKVETILIPIVLPTDNIFGVAARSTGLSVGDGWVALLKLSPGTHAIHQTASGPNISADNTTIITVR